jgi:hypothetical protein
MLRPALHWLGALLVVASCDQRPVSQEPDNKFRRLDEQMPKPRLLSEIQPANFKDTDLRIESRPVWVKSGLKGRNLSQSKKPLFDTEKTGLLANSITADASDKDGTVEVQKEGVVIHPGSAMPTRVDFDVRGKFGRVILHACVVWLPEEALSDRRSGTAGVSVLIDGRSFGWASLDRHTNQSIKLDLSHASELSVVVDNYDNVNFWDWCMVGLE